MEGEPDWIPLIGATSTQDALDQIAFLTLVDQKHQPAHLYSYRVQVTVLRQWVGRSAH